MVLTLRPSDDYCFFEVFDHEGKTAGREAHCIRAVDDDEGVKLYISGCVLS